VKKDVGNEAIRHAIECGPDSIADVDYACIVWQVPRRLGEIVMKRRLFLAGMLVSIVGACKPDASTAGRGNMRQGAPEKIRLIPDEWHIEHVGRLADGRLFWVDGQLEFAGGATKDFICTFIFDPDGRLVEHTIELIGVRGSYPEASGKAAMDRHLAALGKRKVADIWVRPFSVESHGTVFGLIPRQIEGGGEWRVEFMPGNTLSFYAPWDAGEYDT
jgi:hypothetical protein